MFTPSRTAVRRVALSRLISLTGNHAAFTALMFTVYQRTHSSAWVSLALLATFGASGLVSPVAGALGDRFDRRRVMVISDLLGAGVFAVMAFARGPASLILLALAAALVESPFYPAAGAAIPNLAGEEELGWANGTVSLGRNIGVLVGPALGGALVAWRGAGLVFGLNAASFVLSGALVWSVRGRFADERSDHPEHRGMRAGFIFLARDRVLRTITLAWVVLLLGVGSVLVAELPLTRSFGVGSIGYGLIATSWGAGAIAGSLLGRRMLARHEPWALLGGTAGMAFGFGAIAVMPVFGPVLACMVAAGFGDALTGVAETGIVQRRTPDAVRSRVMAATDATVTIALAASFGFAGYLVSVLGPKGVYAVAGAGCALGVALLLPVLAERQRSLDADGMLGGEVAEGTSPA